MGTDRPALSEIKCTSHQLIMLDSFAKRKNLDGFQPENMVCGTMCWFNI